MKKFLYVGGFILPDKNAAAQRVVSIAKGLRLLGHAVVFLNYSPDIIFPDYTELDGFLCYERPKQTMYNHLTNIDDIKAIIQRERITDVITYNYPAVALSKLIWYCRANGISVFADVTEWYVAKGNILFRVIKTIDSEWRMRFLHKRTDGIIAISDFLYSYYRRSVNTVKIPPTVDILDEKWNICRHSVEAFSGTTFVYAGNPSAQKERLDIIVKAIETVSSTQNVRLYVVGISQEEYEKMYGMPQHSSCVLFCGRLSHVETLKIFTIADWSIIIRENNKVVRAGFPTKLVESISCGTPVIANRFSNISDYINAENGILIDEPNEIVEVLKRIVSEKCCRVKDKELFDYRRFLNELSQLFDQV